VHVQSRIPFMTLTAEMADLLLSKDAKATLTALTTRFSWSQQIQLPQAEEFDQGNQVARKNHESLLIVGKFLQWGLAALVGILIPARTSTLTKDGTELDTLTLKMPPTAPSLMDHILSLLPNETVLEILHNHKTPQSQALQRIMADPFLENYATIKWKVVHRFALATILYAWRGPNWFNNKNWLSNNVF
jgi:hypothetical protein